MDSTHRLKQKLTVSYAEYRELEKSWMAARALVRAGRPCAGACRVATAAAAVVPTCCCHCWLQVETLEAERDDLQQKVDCYEEARQVSSPRRLHTAPGLALLFQVPIPVR